MGEGGWTPGPWHVEPVTGEDDQQFWSDDFNGKVFCVCHPRTECDATTVVPWLPEADAHLIAAAPAMYSALRAAKSLCDNINEFGHVTDSIILDAAEAAINAALALARTEPPTPTGRPDGEGGNDAG